MIADAERLKFEFSRSDSFKIDDDVAVLGVFNARNFFKIVKRVKTTLVSSVVL